MARWTKTPLERFEEKFRFKRTKYGICWQWTASTFTKGYGRFVAPTVTSSERANRFAYTMYVGPPGDLHVLHKCDNPGCVNPAHLWLGTDEDNRLDKIRKGRQARGETAGTAKLKEADVIAIRSDDRIQREIAEDYGVSVSLVSLIKNGKLWKHVGEDDG